MIILEKQHAADMHPIEKKKFIQLNFCSSFTDTLMVAAAHSIL